MLGVSYPTIDNIVMILCGATALIYATDTFYNYYNSKKVKEESKDLSMIMPTSWSDYRHFVFLAIAAGVCEEIVFRGFLVNYIIKLFEAQSYNYYLALVIPGIIFSISHIYQGVFAVVKIFSLSLLFGAIFLYSKSLLLVIIIHVLVDLISGAVMVLVYNKNKA
jgi:membrane protease YdiL (CAAX protease family)